MGRVRRLLSAAWGGWDRFFFTPTSTAPLAIVRLAYGLIVTLWTLTQLPYLFTFYGPDGVLPAPPALDPWQWGLLTTLNSVPAVAVVFLATLLAGIALAIGASPRIAAVVVLLGLIAFERRNPFVLNSGDVLLRVMAVYLIFAPSGDSLSWDRWRRDRARFWEFPRRAPWAMRMLQIQVSIIYLAAVWAKLQGDVWRNGTALAYALRMLDQLRAPSLEVIAAHGLLTEWLTFGTLLIELSVAILVWNRKLRPWVLGVGALFHLGIEVFIMVGFFSIGMWVLYLVFLSPDWTERTVLRLRDRWRARRRPEAEDEASASDVKAPEPAVSES
ncbi:HTTM domain-containing protein [Actinomycetospora termitidis]|uniref:HTTM domain-containing protein n=1 Tax=Actinomycetospora termitidis TaxID=3053470 RepID=A0ABT7MHT0_9PSEU|nr:HTTM domain-containing protein [Actinomycetospora sp. Odt1-22]MDL5160205.1 HTTM domain-containing protein [Actinomycetospora sp. Odt1-22]